MVKVLEINQSMSEWDRVLKSKGPKLFYPEKSRVGITGSPGTGKNSIGGALSALTHLNFVSINEFAIKNGFGKKNGSEYIIDTRRLSGKIETPGRIITGHLLPFVVPDEDLDLVIVLRTSPSVLRSRYQTRMYPDEKILENVEAEMIGVISAKCAQTYDWKKIAEFDTSRTRPETIARRALDIIKGRSEANFGSIDWLSVSSASSLRKTLHGKYNRLNIPKGITRFANPKARKTRYYSRTRR